MIAYEGCKVAPQPQQGVAVVVPEFEKGTAGPHAGPQFTKTLLRVGDIYYLRKAEYGHAHWYVVDPDSEYEPPEEGAPAESTPHSSDMRSCGPETEHLLEAVLTQVLDADIGDSEDYDSGEPFEPESNADKL